MTELWTDAVKRLEKEIVYCMMQVAYLESDGVYYNTKDECFDFVNVNEVKENINQWTNEAKLKALQMLRYRSRAYEDMLTLRSGGEECQMMPDGTPFIPAN